MPKFFVSYPVAVNEEDIHIQGDDQKHIHDVLRMKVGETLTVCDSAGMDHLCEIESFEETGVLSRILSRKISGNEPFYEIVIYQGLPKAEKMETIIQKCVELGGARVVPVTCTRSVVRLNEKKDIEKKVQRWNRIAEEAAKQCNRSRIPRVDAPVSFKEAVLQMKQADVAFIPWEYEEQAGIRSVLEQARYLMKEQNETKDNTGDQGREKTDAMGKCKHDKPILAFLIGPEGGIAPEEILLAKQNGLTTVTLGKRILRTETVAPAVLAMILYETEL